MFMSRALMNPKLPALPQLLHGELGADANFLIGSFTLHVSISFLLGFGWDGH